MSIVKYLANVFESSAKQSKTEENQVEMVWLPVNLCDIFVTLACDRTIVSKTFDCQDQWPSRGIIHDHVTNLTVIPSLTTHVLYSWASEVIGQMRLTSSSWDIDVCTLSWHLNSTGSVFIGAHVSGHVVWCCRGTLDIDHWVVGMLEKKPTLQDHCLQFK